MQSTCHSPRSVPSAMLNVIVEDRTGELRLLDRGVQIRIMWMASYPWIVRRDAANSRKPCLAFTRRLIAR